MKIKTDAFIVIVLWNYGKTGEVWIIIILIHLDRKSLIFFGAVPWHAVLETNDEYQMDMLSLFSISLSVHNNP